MKEDSDPPSQGLRIPLPQILAVQEDTPLLGVVEPEQKLNDGTLTRAVFSDKGALLPRRKSEREVSQGVVIASRVAESYVPEENLAVA